MSRESMDTLVVKSSILLAQPFMLDPNFKRAVVLIAEHSEEEGSIGFILNKPFEININDLIPDFPKIESGVFLGGPVANETLHFIHDVGQLLDESNKISSGVYWGGDFEKLKFLIQSKLVQPHNIRFFLGYSGWSSGQLEDEMEYGSWILAEMDPNYAFKSKYNSLWNQVMKNKGGQYSVIAEMPESSYLN